MEISDLFPQPDKIRTVYCDSCKGYMALRFSYFSERISGVHIEVAGFPVLRCEVCDIDYLPEDSCFSLIRLHEQATEKGKDLVRVERKKTSQKFGYTKVPFEYDSDDYKYIPGLQRPHSEGFLTPVFFKKEVLLKYDISPIYRLSFSSRTYGNIIHGDEYSCAFGVNSLDHVIMWLGDISKLPEKEQYYLCSENIESDHLIGSEFYDGQIECIFTDRTPEDKLFRKRSEFLEAYFLKSKMKIGHLDNEVLELYTDFNSPIVDTPRERRNVADTLNKVYIESFDNKSLQQQYRISVGDPGKLGSLKLLQGILEVHCPSLDVSKLMSPFFVLYDMRVACSHLSSASGSEGKIKTVTDRLDLDEGAPLIEIYNKITKEMTSSFEVFTQCMVKNT